MVMTDVPASVFRALRDRPGRGDDVLRFDAGRLEIALPGGPPTDVRPVPDGQWRETFLRLEGVTGRLYRDLRRAGDNRRVRLTHYDRTLEIEVATGSPHDYVSRLLFAFVSAWCEEFSIDVRPSGSATWWADGVPGVDPDDLPGLEADETFHVRSFEAVRGRDRLRIANGDPPPDLAVEVVFSSPLNGKERTYAALGVGELWVWRDDALTVRTLADGGEFMAAADSPNLPGFPFALAAGLIARRNEGSQTELLREFREAVRPAAGREESGAAG